MSMEKELIAAVRSRNLDRAKELLEQQPNLAQTKTEEGSLLLTAIYYGANTIAPLIHALRDDLNIHEAAAYGDVNRIAELLETNPTMANQYAPDGVTPLGLCAYMRKPDAVRLLLAHGADPNAFSRTQSTYIPRNTALHAACAGGSWDAARLLVEAGAVVNVVDSSGVVPLHNAAANGGLETVQLLLSKGAHVDLRDKKGQTPLHLASAGGHTQIVDLLKQHGAQE